MDAWLETSDGSRIAVKDGFAIGRGADNDLPLPDERASRRHALFQDRGKEGFWIMDLGSRNGTYRNDRRVQQPSRLHDGDRIRVGLTEFIFSQPGMPKSSTTVCSTQVTIVEVRREDCWLLIGDLIGSTELVQKADPGQVSRLTAEWLRHCQGLIESSGGIINKFLGDGFLAFWKAAQVPPEKIAGCVEGLNALQQAGNPRFRLVLHRGQVQMGGGASLGEDQLSGPEVNFAFRMEKLAGSLGEGLLISQTAASQCPRLGPLEDAGEHSVPGFPGSFQFYRL